MSEPNLTITRQERPNSYEFGKAANRFKLYFETAEDLQKQLIELKEKGFDIENAYLVA